MLFILTIFTFTFYVIVIVIRYRRENDLQGLRLLITSFAPIQRCFRECCRPHTEGIRASREVEITTGLALVLVVALQEMGAAGSKARSRSRCLGTRHCLICRARRVGWVVVILVVR